MKIQSTIFSRLTLGYLSIIVIMGFMNGYTVLKLHHLNNEAVQIFNVDQRIADLDHKLVDFILSELWFDKKYAITGDPVFHGQRISARENFDRIMTQALAIVDTAEKKDSLNKVSSLHREYQSLAREAMEKVRTECETHEKHAQKREEVVDLILAELKELEVFSNQDIFMRMNMLGRTAGSARKLTVLMLLVTVIVVISISYVGTVTITRPLKVLMKKTKEISKGVFNGDLNINSPPEVAALAKAMNMMCDGLKEMETVKSEFFSTISHELRTPLASIKHGISLLHDSIGVSITDKQKRLFTILSEETYRLIEIVNCLLELSKMEAGMMPYHFKEANLPSLIEKVITEMTPLFEAKHIRIQLTLDKATPLLKLDRERILQVLRNLIGNAVKFTPGDGLVEIALSPRNQMVELCVRDTGPGIPKENLHTIFEKFCQSSNKISEGMKGTGLGLALVKQIIMAHGGNVWGRKRTGPGKRIYLCVALLTCLCIPSCMSPLKEIVTKTDDEPRQCLLRAERLLVRNNFDASLRESLKALSLSAKEPPGDEALFNIGLIYIYPENPKRDYGKAVVYLKRIVKEYPQQPLVGQAKIWIVVLQENIRLRRESSEVVREKARLKRLWVEAVQENGRLKRVIEQANKVDVEIEERKGEKPGKVTMSLGKILVVDDEENLVELIQMGLEAGGYEVVTAYDEGEAIKKAGEQVVDLALVDLHLARTDGITLMEDLHLISPLMPVIILTGYGSIENAVEAMKRGAYSYLTKPFEAQGLLYEIQKVMENRRLNTEIERLKDLLETKYGFANIIGRSSKMQSVLETVSRVAKTDSTVLLLGESGTGKDLIAKAIHLSSERKDKRFVAINCAALPEALLESNLFGHERGAFSGAIREAKGLFLQAHEGTIFLDEIADMPLSIQAKILRVLQERRFRPVGGERVIDVDVRIIVATNKNLEEQVELGLFRQDLYYRVHVIPILLSPLRERKEDIIPLAEHFLDKARVQMKKEVKGFTPQAMQKLMFYDSGPGNVRELENVVEYAAAMTDKELITEDFILQTKTVTSQGPVRPLREAKEAFERSYLIYLLETSKGNVSEAARLAGKYRSDFYDLLKKHNLTPYGFKKTG